MRYHPDDLKRALDGIKDGAQLDRPNAGRLAAFLRICEALEPRLEFIDADSARLDWLYWLSELRFTISQWEHIPNAAALNLQFSAAGLHMLAGVAQRSWRGPATGPLRPLPFCSDRVIREIAERDLASMHAAVAAEETKMAIVLGGFVIEALLTDVIETHIGDALKAAASVKVTYSKRDPAWKGFKEGSPERWDFEEKIAVCGPTGLGALSERAEQTAQLVRKWRNLVHPSLERADRQKNGPLVPADSAAAAALVERVICDVGSWWSKKTGSVGP
jgi:hypothetical protein